ncbi:MAG: NTP transferase domain-containing protein [Sphingomonadales bacterium]|nr:NTP transferase domain-containing protein [Sphingomonadales bacterium]
MARIHPVILCGGNGTRLWPRSRAAMPKPFLPLVGNETLFEEALSRAGNAAQFAPATVVTGAAHIAHVEAQMHDNGLVIVEPAARNTAAAIALAAAMLDDDAVMLVCPSDHHIGNRDAFVAAAQAAANLARQGWLVAFGIAATAPETGYGYIRRGEAIDDAGFRIERFVEKPDRARAEAFLADGGYSWNGGIFAFRAGDFLRELAAHRPAIAQAVQAAVAGGRRDDARFHPDADAFAAIAGESVDYAVMENTTRAAVVPVAMDWSDIGNWEALHQARARDADGNTALGRHELVDCRNVMVETDGPRVSVIGLSNVIVVVDGDEVLVTTAAGAQLVGKLGGAANQ